MQRDFLGLFTKIQYNGSMEQQDGVYFKRRALSEAGIAYSVSAVLPVILSLILGVIAALAAGEKYADTDWYRFLSYLLPQVCFAAAALIFFRRSKVSVRETYRGCKWYYFLIAILLQFGLMFPLEELNGRFIAFLEKFGYENAGVALPSLDGWNLLPAILTQELPDLFHIIRCPRKRSRDKVKALLDAEQDILPVLFTDKRHADIISRKIDPFSVGNRTAVLHDTVYILSFYTHDLKTDKAVIYENAVAGFYILI